MARVLARVCLGGGSLGAVGDEEVDGLGEVVGGHWDVRLGNGRSGDGFEGSSLYGVR